MSNWNLRSGAGVARRVAGLSVLLALCPTTGCELQTLLDLPQTDSPGTVTWQWQTDPATAIDATPALGPDGNLYVTTGVSPTTDFPVQARLVSLTPGGVERWQSDKLEWTQASEPVIDSKGTIYVVSGFTIYAYLPNGSLSWRWSPPKDGVPYAHQDLCGVAVGPDDTVYAYHCGGGAYPRFLFAFRSDGTLKWADDLTGVGQASNLAVGKGGVLLAMHGPLLRAYNPTDGALRWSLSLNVDVNAGGLAVADDGTIYVPTYVEGGKLIAVSSEGIRGWEAAVPSPGVPAIGEDGTIYVMASSGYVDGDLYALNPADGTIKWQLGNSASSGGLAVASDGTVYASLVVADQTTFAAVDAHGVAEWSLNVPTVAGAPVVGPKGTIYVAGGSMPGQVTAISGSAPLASSSWPRSRGGNRSSRSWSEH